MKYRSLLSIFMLLIVVTAITVTAFTIDMNSQTISRENITSTSVKSEIIEDGIELEKEIKEGKSFTTAIDIPITKIENIDDYIRNWSVEKEDELFSEVEQMSASLSKNAVAHIVITPIIKKIEKNLLAYEIYSQYTIEDPSLDENIFHSEVDTFTFNLKNEQLVSLSDVLLISEKKQDSKFSSFLDTLTNEKLKTEIAELTIHNQDDFQWMITSNGIIFLLQNEKNNQKIERHLIEFKELKPILTDSYKKQFIKEEKPKAKKKKTKHKTKKMIALTFDDGPDEEVTPQILKTLKKYNAKATFFMLVSSVEKNPKLAKQIAKDGHEIANHSYSHANLTQIKRSRIEKELIQSKETIESITGAKIKLFRPPYGNYNQAVLDLANDSDQKVIMWSVDPQDWKHRNKHKIYENVMYYVKPGSIVLMHDIHQATADALPKLLKQLKDDGFEFVTVSELIAEIEAAPNGVYYGK